LWSFARSQIQEVLWKLPPHHKQRNPGNTYY